MQNSFLSLKEIKKCYYGKNKTVHEALKGVSFELQKGEVFALLGANGAGKTTLSSILATLHPPTHGEILWEGESIYRNILRFRKIIGFCPQKPNLDQSLTLEETLLLAGRCFGLSKELANERKDLLVEQFRLAEYIKSNPSVLSGGYKQRFLIARALMHNPELVILDEPTVGLDPHIRRQLWEVIAQLKSRGITVLLTTHYLDEAEHLSDRVCLIHKGMLRLIDTPANLKKQHQKNNLEEVFLKFIEDPDSELFNSVATEEGRS